MKLKTSIITALLITGFAQADNYKIDKEGAHAFINFKVSHLGYSFVSGTFKDFDGTFEYDSTSNKLSNVKVLVKTDSVDSNHAERDKHIRGKDFLNVSKFPEASFVSNDYSDGKLSGDLTLHGVTKAVSIPMAKIGEGKDPWGGYRAGFQGEISLPLKEFGIERDLGPASQNFELEIIIEGIKQ